MIDVAESILELKNGCKASAVQERLDTNKYNNKIEVNLNVNAKTGK